MFILARNKRGRSPAWWPRCNFLFWHAIFTKTEVDTVILDEASIIGPMRNGLPSRQHISDHTPYRTAVFSASRSFARAAWIRVHFVFFWGGGGGTSMWASHASIPYHTHICTPQENTRKQIGDIRTTILDATLFLYIFWKHVVLMPS